MKIWLSFLIVSPSCFECKIQQVEPGKIDSMEQFFCVGLGSVCYLSCLDSCSQTYVLRKIKAARFMLC